MLVFPFGTPSWLLSTEELELTGRDASIVADGLNTILHDGLVQRLNLVSNKRHGGLRYLICGFGYGWTNLADYS